MCVRTVLRSPLLIFAWVVILLAAYAQYWTAFSSDKKWLLLAAQMAFEGKRLYVDIFETNPPLIVWIYQIPVWFSVYTNTFDFITLLGLVYLLILFSVCLCGRVMRLHPYFAGNERAKALHSLQVAAALTFWVNSIYFGDREHVFVICVLPYLLRSMPGLYNQTVSVGVRVCIGLLAGLGFCMKPHTMLVLGAVQLFWLVRERSLACILRMETLIIAATGISYLGAVALLTPEYFQTMLPMTLAAYGGHRNNFVQVMFYLPALFTIGLALAEFRLRHTTPIRQDIFYFLWLCVAALLYALSHNGWLYSLYPLNALVLLTVGWLWMEYRWLAHKALDEGGSASKFRQGAIACFIVFTFNAAGSLLPYGAMFVSEPAVTTHVKVMRSFEAIMREHHFTSFGAFPVVSPPWPALARSTGAKFSTRFHMLWMLRHMAEERQSPQKWVTEYVAAAYAHDLAVNKPQVVFVDTSPKFEDTGKPLDIPALFNGNAAFREAWGRYRFMERVDFCEETDPAWRNKPTGFCRYDVFRRVE